MPISSATLTNSILALLGLFAVYTILRGDWSSFFVVLQAIVLSIIPHALERRFEVHTPDVLRLGVVVFVVMAIILGELNHFYETFAWWDAVLHTAAGYGLALIAFVLLTRTYHKRNIARQPIMTSLFAFSLVLAVSVLWELYEFTIDSLSGSANMQPSLADTMWDFIVASLGAAAAVLSGLGYLRARKPAGMVQEVIHEAVKKNMP